MEVLVFKTNVSNKRKVSKVRHLLASVSAIKQWNFDLEDCDKVLRVETVGLRPAYVETLLQNAGFDCREMDY
ncbi:MAG TPA: hypothetical protein VHB54_17250 [Mucilaginibacter sp.]|nr:hypothetical protein [Bacteroidota bacterium]HVS91661.1 hypothetical protein [Mucilaginibacter sp.]HVW15583.1 hypothetical protein [Mucilaginibacter sp.]